MRLVPNARVSTGGALARWIKREGVEYLESSRWVHLRPWNRQRPRPERVRNPAAASRAGRAAGGCGCYSSPFWVTADGVFTQRGQKDRRRILRREAGGAPAI